LKNSVWHASLKLKRGLIEAKEGLNKGVNLEFDFSNVKLEQPSPESQPGIRNSALKAVEFR